MSTKVELPPVLTPQQVMDWLGIKRTKLYSLVDQGLPYHSLSPGGRTKVFYPSEVQAWLDGRRESRAPVAAAPAQAANRGGRPRKGAAKPEGESGRKWIKGY